MGFQGPVWPVNPKYTDVLSAPCYPTLADLPQAPDVTALCVGRAQVLPSLHLLAKRGGRAAVIYDSGFAEVGGEGKRMQDEITGLCREASISICGPNCMGVLNPQGRSTTFKQTVRSMTGLAGNVGLVSQSGSICGTMLADLRRFGFSTVISCGNEAVVSAAAYIEHLVADPHTKVIVAFLESVRQPEQFVAALDRAADCGKPVVVLKVGRSERTRNAITSHTGGLAGESRVFSEVLRAHRAIEVGDLDELTEVVAACQSARWPKGAGINVLTTSGGQAELILDVATSCGIELTPVTPETRDRVECDVGQITGDGNPLDAWGNGDARTNMPRALAALDANPGTDVVVFCSSDSTDNQPLGRAGRELEYADILVNAAKGSDKPHYMMTMRPGVLHNGQIEALRTAGVGVISGSRQGLGALLKLGRWQAQRPQPRRTGRHGAQLPAGRRIISEFEAKTLLASWGVPVTREHLVQTAAEALAAARDLHFPVVLKVVSDAIPHKSEHGLVRVGLSEDDQLRAALADMQDKVVSLGCPIDGWLVQEMIGDGIEVFAGVSQDPQFGPMLAFGMGGVAIDLLQDFALRQLPLRDGDAAAMIGEVRGAALLGAYRGKPAADIPALVECLLALADFATVHADQIAEIDLNPIKVRSEGRGCVLVDALIVCRDPA